MSTTSCAVETLCKRKQYSWTQELDSVLEQGYRAGRQRAAIDIIQGRTGWSRQVCWDRARKLGLSEKRSTPPRRWTPGEEQRLITLAGRRNVCFIAQQLSRSVASVRKRLRRLGGLTARVSEGMTKNQLAELIGASPKTVQRWIEAGWLNGSYEGKSRSDDSIRISDKQFLDFWRTHPERLSLHRCQREGLEWLLQLLGERAVQDVQDP